MDIQKKYNAAHIRKPLWRSISKNLVFYTCLNYYLSGPMLLRGLFGTCVSIMLFSGCTGPDLGSTKIKNRKLSDPETDTTCLYCLQVPQILEPFDHTETDNTRARILISPLVAEACEYSFSGGINFSMVLRRSEGSITEFRPQNPWPLGQNIQVSVRCFNNDDLAQADSTAVVRSDFTVRLAKPAVILPFDGYTTTSNLLRVKGTAHAPAVSYHWEIRQSGNTIFEASSSSAETVLEIPFPPGVVGLFEVRTRYRDINEVYSEYSDRYSFVIKDRSAATATYAQDFTVAALCGEKITLLLAGCSGVSILGTYPSCDPIGWFGGGGNVWICNTGFENTNVLQTNNSAHNNLALYSGVFQNVDVTDVSYQVETHQHGTAEASAATVISCRVYPAEGNDGFALVIYPYRTTGINVEIREKRFSTNTYAVLAEAYRPEAQFVSGPSRSWLRFDCLGDSLTGYFKNSSGKWYPLVVGRKVKPYECPDYFA